jgi:hypothetical protein
MGATMREFRSGVTSFVLDANVTATNTTQETDVTIPGLTTDMFVMVNKPSHSTGAAVVGARVKSADTLSITYMNATGSAVNPASETYLLYWYKPESVVPTVVNP